MKIVYIYLIVACGAWSALAAPIRRYNCRGAMGEYMGATRQEAPLRIEEINYITRGTSDKPALLLVHGQDSAWQTFTPLLQHLEHDFYVIAVDLRGHGESAAPSFDFSSRLLSADLKVLLDHLKVNKVHLLAHSFGTKAVLRFAAQNPQRVSSITIEDMEVQKKKDFSDSAVRQAEHLKQALPQNYASRAQLIDALETHLYDYIPPAQRRAYVENIVARRARSNSDGSWQLLFRPWVSSLFGMYFVSEEIAGLIHAIHAPVMLIAAGPGQSAVSSDGFHYWQVLKPGIEIVIIRDATHNVHGSRTREFLAALLPFLRRN